MAQMPRTGQTGTMQTLLLVLAAAALLLYGAAVVVMLVGIRRAPHGYEDEAGFHYGDDRRATTRPAPRANPHFWRPVRGAY